MRLVAALAALFLATAAFAGDDISVDEALDRVLVNRLNLGFASAKHREKFAAGEAELGRELFFDPRLSRTRAMSCAACHQPSRAWADGLPTALGSHHQKLPRNTPSLLDSSRKIKFFVDGRADSFEDAALVALQNHDEMDMTLPEISAFLDRVPGYAREFRSVYGAAPDAAKAARAMAAFAFTQARSGPSAFDRFRSDRAAFTAEQTQGLRLFAGKARCTLCHEGPFFSDNSFHDIGLKRSSDLGREGIVGAKGASASFLTPPLRHAALTGPYMHDGSLSTLEEVVEFYDRGGDVKRGQDPQIMPLHLTAPEKAALAAFVRSLAGPLEPVTAPALPLESADGPRAAAPPAPDRGRCLSEYSDDGLFKALARPDAASRRWSEPLVRAAMTLRAYRAFDARDSSLCDGFDMTVAQNGVNRPASFLCRETALDMLLTATLVARDKSFPRICDLDLENQYPYMTPSDRAGVCAVVFEKRDEPSELCDRLIPKYLLPENREACVYTFGRYSHLDDAEYCRSLVHAPTELRDVCVAMASYARAYRARDAKLCAGTELCRVMMGDGAALEASYSASAKDLYCGGGSR
jgi:cytochrome c peroxidase